jgi:hypothetical protein
MRTICGKFSSSSASGLAKAASVAASFPATEIPDAIVPWSTRFAPPIKLLGGGKLFTLKDAIGWLAKEIPQSEHTMKQVQAAAHRVTEAAENGGPMGMFARMGMMQAINRHKPEEFDPKRKSPHWGKRKVRRDQ